MKVVLGVVICCVFYFTGHSQVTLTKGETIEYLNKKIKECVGHVFTIDPYREMIDAEVKLDPKGIVVQFKWKSDKYYSSIYVFNPAHITTIQRYANTTTSSVNELKLNLVGKTCVFKAGESYYGFANMGESKSFEYVNFPWLRADPANEEKIKKALLYLRDLLKAEEDPFK